MRRDAVEFEVDGLRLRGEIYFAAQPKTPAMLFVHGWTGVPNTAAAEALAENGFTSMTFSLRGHNDSGGDINRLKCSDFYKDLLAAYEVFKNRLPRGGPIGLAGTSFGSYLAVLLSAEQPVECLSLKVPANYPDAGFDKLQINQSGDSSPQTAEWRRHRLGHQDNRALAALHNFGGDVQIIEAGADEIVPHRTVQNYVDAVVNKSKLDYQLMQGWTHSLGTGRKRNRQYQELLLNWLLKQYN